MIMYGKHKVFISYHHAKDQAYKAYLATMAAEHGLFIDRSVDTGAVSDNLAPERIRGIIRDKYLRDATVTIVLVGLETRSRKHVDWEIYSSMINGKRNKKSGILVIMLPTAPIFSLVTSRTQATSNRIRSSTWGHPVVGPKQWKQAFPSMPDRIVDNLANPKAFVLVTRWIDIALNPEYLRALIQLAFRNRKKCQYDLSRPMRRRNS